MWSDIINDWSNGKPLKYPKNIKNRFQWNTSVLRKTLNSNSRLKQILSQLYKIIHRLKNTFRSLKIGM